MNDSLREHLLALNVDVLKDWLKRVAVPLKGVTRKDQFARLVEQQLSLHLPEVLDRLTPAERHLLADSAHQGRLLSAREFSAKYGQACPLPKVHRSWKEEVSLLTPFIHYPDRWRAADPGLVPSLVEPLRACLPKPAGLTVETVDKLPTHWPSEQQCQGGDLIRPLHVFEGERIAPVELSRVLQLIQGGKVRVTPKGGRPTDATARLVGQALVMPDFDLEMPADHRRGRWDAEFYQAAGAVRAHAWPVLAQQCGWARQKGGSLTLTDAGRDILQQFTPEKFREGVRGCLGNSDFDELNRINHIRGQGGKAKRWLSDPGLRKWTIVEAMDPFPIGRWLKFEEARRIVEAAPADWNVLETDRPALYFFNPEFGYIWDNLGLGRQFMRAFFLESLATLGLVDVAFVYPHQLWPDLQESLNGDLPFCGRYDGLLYVRLNPLGAHTLGFTDDYLLSEEESPGLFRVLPNHDLVLTEAALNPADRALLELLAVRKSEQVWRLDPGRVLGHVESGGSFSELSGYLETHAIGGVPDAVRTFLDGIEGRLGACRSRQDAVLLEWSDEAQAQLIASSTGTRKYCHHAGDNRVVVPAKNLTAFTRALKQLGYVLPAGS